MKFLLAILITLNIMAGNQSRISSAILTDLKTLNSDHCAQIPAYEAECVKDYSGKMLKKLKSLNSLLINEKFVAARKEEKGKIKYEPLLAKESISYPAESSADQMKEIYKSTMEERSCVQNYKEYLDSASISYSQSDTCAILQPIVQEKQCVDNLRIYLTEVGVVYTQENTCADLMILQEEYLAQL